MKTATLNKRYLKDRILPNFNPIKLYSLLIIIIIIVTVLLLSLISLMPTASFITK